MGSPSKVGKEVASADVLAVAAKLQAEGLARLDSNPASAHVALAQAFALELQYGVDGERLCRACASLCRALSRMAAPAPPVDAVAPLVKALDKAQDRLTGLANRVDPTIIHDHAQFLARELLGLARKLGGGCARGGAPPRVEALRAADRAYERLRLHAAAVGPLRLGGPGDLELTQQEICFQQGLLAQRIGTVLMRADDPAGSAAAHSVRESEAACFYLQRAARKLRLAGVAERDEAMRSLRQQLAVAETQALPSSPGGADPTQQGARPSEGGGGAGAAEAEAEAEEGAGCVVS